MGDAAFGSNYWLSRGKDVAGVIILALLGWISAGVVGLGFGALIGALAVAAPRAVRIATIISPMVLAAFTMLDGELSVNATRTFASSRMPAHLVGLLAVLTWLAAAWVGWRRAEHRPAWEHPTGSASADDDQHRLASWPTFTFVVVPLALAASALAMTLVDG